MHNASPSRTAYRVAIRRAEHQILDSPRVFDDALALQIVGPEMAAKIGSGRVTRQQRLSPSFRAFIAVRSRYAEDELAKAVQRGIKQYVVLGAGLDTFAYRNPYSTEGLRVVEVDHPATQAWKKELLQKTGIAIPPDMTFVGFDFERQNLASALRTAGFNFDEPAFCSWLGVVPYLTHHAFAETAAFIASLPAGSGVVFDYAVPRSSLNHVEGLALDALARRVAAAGEPLQLFLDPAQLAASLCQVGFTDIEDLGRDQMNQRYFDGRGNHLRVKGNLAHLLSACLGAPECRAPAAR